MTLPALDPRGGGGWKQFVGQQKYPSERDEEEKRDFPSGGMPQRMVNRAEKVFDPKGSGRKGKYLGGGGKKVTRPSQESTVLVGWGTKQRGKNCTSQDW